MGAGEFARWRRFVRDEPLPADRSEILAGTSMALLANIHRGKTQQPFEASDFMPVLKPMIERAKIEAARADAGVEAEDEDDAILQRLVIGAGGDLG